MSRKTTGPRNVGVMGRWSIFRDKANGKRVQGVLTKHGGEFFEQSRERLMGLYKLVMGREPASVSDADTIEFLAMGEHETTKYLRKQLRIEKESER